jgi:hypothetical protein
MTLGDNFNRLIETGHWNRQPQYAIHFVHNSSSGYAANIACNGYIKASDMLETDSTFTAVVWTPTDSVVTKEILERKFIEKCSDITFPTILY